MKAIVTLTLNPTIDGSASADVIHPMRKIRTSDERYHPGGGGINVARVVCELGGSAKAIYLAGGATGGILDELLTMLGIETQRIGIGGVTRIAHTVFERSSGLEYRFVPEGPAITRVEWRSCLDALEKLDFDYVVASGSLPRGLPDDAYCEVVAIAKAKGARVILDTSGPALAATLQGGEVFLVKPSLGELESLVGRKLADARAQEEAAHELVDGGQVEIVAVTMGGEGALLVAKSGSWRKMAPPIVAQSAVGAGDSFVAAMALALAQDRPLELALAYAVAAGTAAVLSPGAELCMRKDVERLYAGLV